MSPAWWSRAIAATSLAGLLAVAGCGRDRDSAAPPATAVAVPVVDSALPRDEALRRFRSDLDPIDSLAGPTTRDSLAAAFIEALATQDTAALGTMLLSRREFAWILYPSSPQGLPPYDLAPALMWDMLVRQSDRGLSDALQRFGGRDLELLSFDCGAEPSAEGENQIWGPCRYVITVSPADTVETRLTGPMIEHAARFKFVSLTNDLD